MMNLRIKAILGSLPLLIILTVAAGVTDILARQLMTSLGVVYGAFLFRYLIKYQEKNKSMPRKQDLVG
jgi:hypothetical protein